MLTDNLGSIALYGSLAAVTGLVIYILSQLVCKFSPLSIVLGKRTWFSFIMTANFLICVNIGSGMTLSRFIF